MENFIGSLLIFSFGFAPKGWATCDGQSLPINQNQALFSLLGTTYGGDGRTIFGLPDLRGRVAMHTGGGHTLGERAGLTSTTLTINNLPLHNHDFTFAPPCNTAAGTTADPTGAYPAASVGNTYATTANVSMGVQTNQTTTGSAGQGQAVPVMQPYLVLNYCIALQGVFPSTT